MCIFMALSTVWWYYFEVCTSEELQMLGQALECMKNKNISQNSKIMFRTKFTAKSISQRNYFSPLLQKKAYNIGTKPYKRNLLYSLLDRISNFWYAKYDLILSRNMAAEAFQEYCQIFNFQGPETSLYCWNFIYLNDNLTTFILQPIVKAVSDRHYRRKSKTPFS